VVKSNVENILSIVFKEMQRHRPGKLPDDRTRLLYVNWVIQS
jgi:hypothetical protein